MLVNQSLPDQSTTNGNIEKPSAEAEMAEDDTGIVPEDEKTRCGRFHNVKVFLFLMCLFSITQG